MDSQALGSLFLPPLQDLFRRIPRLQCAALFTVDGVNICAIGLSEQQLGKMAALSASAIAIGDASFANLRNQPEDRPAMQALIMESEGLQIVSQRIIRPGGDLILMAAADAALGVVLLGMRQTDQALRALFFGGTSAG
jgi:predicted regulator of Ras-like GTPase activity (Roadblock/LC7/MglB family)